ncbi:hypothetical protein LK542_09920 [Massilia sp. IC2-477]|uniref:hypothetical protein n=1 Tax=Massilia sp. IC2-477 TaxID=2887198 RepID=UPI001D109EA6|nr:hypothetical protein [Massilia sp. IC2-477]MCC2955929.1 hypothetical protein [Massilia sp. IC2-477]
MLCLPLYGFAMQGGLPQAYGTQTVAHAVAHDENILHHHHEDDSVHYDASEKSLAHTQDHHSCAQALDLLLPSCIVPPEQLLSSLVASSAGTIPEPFLDGPRKPPRHAPGHAAGGMTHA